MRQAPHITFPQSHSSVDLLLLPYFTCVHQPQAAKMAARVPGIIFRHDCVEGNKNSDISHICFLEGKKPLLEPTLQAFSHVFSITTLSHKLS